MIHEKPISYKSIDFVDYKDTKFDLTSLEKKLYVIYYFASWCVDCIEEIKQMQDMQNKLGNKNFEIITLSEDYKSKAEVIERLAGKFKLDIKVFFDQHNALYKMMNVKTIPSSIIITKDAEEIARITGRGSWDNQYIREFILKSLDKLQANE